MYIVYVTHLFEDNIQKLFQNGPENLDLDGLAWAWEWTGWLPILIILQFFEYYYARKSREYFVSKASSIWSH